MNMPKINASKGYIVLYSRSYPVRMSLQINDNKILSYSLYYSMIVSRQTIRYVGGNATETLSACHAVHLLPSYRIQVMSLSW